MRAAFHVSVNLKTVSCVCLRACVKGAVVYLQISVTPLTCGRVCVFVHAYVYVFLCAFLKWPRAMLLQLRADEFDVIVCGSMACSREPSELDDYMS